mgnify:CR=1 FL=1
MKIGIRTPSIKKSISSRTIGKFKRSITKSTNPKRSIKNKIYNKMTFNFWHLFK